MSATICDSSAVDKYLAQLSNRESERTRRLTIENNKREIPFLVMKYLGIALALALVLWSLGKSIGNSNSFIHKIVNTGYEGAQVSNSYSQLSEDQTICVECLLEESKTIDLPAIEQPDKDVVRNYVIFDYIEFNQGEISQVIVGREYPDVSSEISSSWCYVNIYLDSGIRSQLTFVRTKDGERTEIPINNELANNYGVNINHLIAAKKECTN
jgi:hypothetical protein